MSAVVEFDRVSVVFGPKPEAAIAMMESGAGRAEVQAATGQTLGVHDCSLTVREGESLVLMGLSGSGKSTLLRTVNGLAPVTRGEVRLHDGRAMVSVTRAGGADLRRLRLTRVAMVFQQFGLLPWRTVAENVGLGLEFAGLPAGERRERVASQLALVGLDGWADRKVAELSGGMQQRVGLARALAAEAPVLLMDEPFSALDPLIRARLQDELLALQARLRRTIIFVSHDLDEAFKLGNRIALMDGGRIVQCGAAREIIANPASDYVAEFVAHMNPLEVLRAADIMEPGPVRAPNAPEIGPDATIREVMEQLQKTAALAVTDGGRTLGRISREGVFERLLSPGR